MQIDCCTECGFYPHENEIDWKLFREGNYACPFCGVGVIKVKKEDYVKNK